MAYFTPDDLKLVLRDRRIAELSTDSGEAGDETFLTGFAAEVSSEIDGYLLAYAPPVVDAKVTPILKQHALKIAVYRLFLRGLISGSATTDAKEAADKSYEWLTLVAKGTIALPVAQAEPEIPEAAFITTAGGEESLFDEEDAAGAI